jgi:peptidoglycan/LPS O-acetylase OafA/YrhL
VERAERTTGEGFRPDLEGLRGVAILLVLLFHAGIPGAAGGFVGVDVFFVLSGFLITGLLLRERERTGRIGLAAFYARRARRILPAAALVLAATLGLSLLVLGPLDLERIAGDALACALFVGNLRFAANAMDYFTLAQTPSPFLHYWSLGVEEQFYLLWPAVLILATRGRRPRLGAGLALGAATVASLVVSLVLTDAAAAWAFYSLPARAWQLGLGGLLAVTLAWQRRLPDRLLAIVGWAGLAAVVASMLVIDPAAPYPGTAALMPTLGTAAVIVAGGRPGSPGALLVVRPLRFLGRISYSLYLIHWPLLVLPAAGLAAGETLPLAERAGLGLLAVGLAAASYRFVEEPIHRGRRLALPARATLAAAAATITATIVLSLGVGVDASRTLAAYSVAAPASPPAMPAGPLAGTPASSPAIAAGPLAALPASPAASTGPAPASSTSSPAPPEGSPGATTSPSPPPGTSSSGPSSSPSHGGSSAILGVAGPAPTPRPTPVSAGPQPLPRAIRPPLAAASADWEPLVTDGCTLGNAGSVAHACVFGDPYGSTTVALVGDSHAAQWFPAVDLVAIANHWRLVTYTKISCRFFDLPIYSREMKREYTECEAWRLNVVAALRQLRPALTIVSVAGGMAPIVRADDDPTRQGIATARLLGPVPGLKAIIVDSPQSMYDVPACLASHLGDTRPCRTPRSYALSWRHLKLERAAAASMPATTIVDLTDAICPGDPCPVVLNGTIVYRDVFHLTATFSASLASALAARLPDPAPRPAPVPPSPSPAPPTAATAARPAPPPGTWADLPRPFDLLRPLAI